jgi:hypothetical protein
MNKFFKQMLLAVSCFISFCASAQTLISPITINLPTNPPANTADWATAVPPVMILAQTKLANGQVNGLVQESKILVTIKSGGSKVCGIYNQQNAPMSGFNSASKNWSGANVLSLLGQECTLKPGNYELCVKFISPNMASSNAVIGEACKAFTIVDKKQEVERYSAPQNIYPNNEKVFKESEAKAPLTFRWTPIIPKPRDPVTYRLKVWQIEEGQNAAQARKTNSPIIEKEVTNITQSVEKIVWPKGKQSSFTWNVEASKKNQMGEVEMLGASEPTSFGVGSPCTPDYEFKKDNVYCDENGKVRIIGHVKITPKSTITINNIKVTQVKENNFSGADILTNITSYPILLAVSGNNHLIDFVINNPMCDKTVYIGYTINYTCSTTGVTMDLPCGDTIKNLPCCSCNLCDSNIVKWELPTLIKYDTSWKNGTNNILSLYGPLSFGPYPIVKLSTEIVDFYWFTEGDCKKCNTNDYYFGNLIGGSLSGMVGGTSVAGPGGTPIPSSHQLDFISPTLSGISLNNNINLNISLPPQTQLSCCTDCFRFCIRYTATFMQNGVCKTCSIVKCYESKRKHKKVGLQMYPPLNDCGERGVIIVKDKTGIKEN